jgi:hypothetical protein
MFAYITLAVSITDIHIHLWNVRSRQMHTCCYPFEHTVEVYEILLVMFLMLFEERAMELPVNMLARRSIESVVFLCSNWLGLHPSGPLMRMLVDTADFPSSRRGEAQNPQNLTALVSYWATLKHHQVMGTLLDLQFRIIHVPHEQHEPLYSVHMVSHADLLVNSVDVAESVVQLHVITRAEAEDVLRQVPVVACVGVASHDAGCDDDIFTVDCSHGASKDGVRRDDIDVCRCHGCHSECVW